MATTRKKAQPRPQPAPGRAPTKAMVDAALEARPTRARGNIFYDGIDATKKEGRRTAGGLLRLKTAIERHLPPKLMDGNFLLATWNIREFGNTRYGGRGNEALHYIAEVLSAFDMIAVQEVRQDIAPFQRVMALLGPWWQYLVTDITMGRRGNSERLAFIYDSRKVRFGGLASQVVLPPDEGGKARKPVAQPSRTPFMVGMKAGWFPFTLCAAHILYGTSKPNDPERVEEIRAVANFLMQRAKDRYAWSENMVVLGDFNIFEDDDATMAALTGAGFVVPPAILQKPRQRHYDQIAFRAPYLQDRPRRGKDGKETGQSKLDRSRAGIFPIFEYVFREGVPAEDRRAESVERDLEDYARAMGEKLPRPTDPAKRKAFMTRFRRWRSYQLSDHAPLWIELDTDWSRGLLANRKRGEVGAGRATALSPLAWR